MEWNAWLCSSVGDGLGLSSGLVGWLVLLAVCIPLGISVD